MRRSRLLGVVALVAGVASLAACADKPTEPVSIAPSARRVGGGVDPALVQQVRQLAAQRGIEALPPAPLVRPALVHLGQALMFDPIISGNRDMACATCHVPALATGDGRSLPIGADGVGLGPERTMGRGTVIPRNSPPLFNLGPLRHAFWDGRVQIDAQGHFSTPAGAQLTPAMQRVFEFGAVSAQPMFPPTSTAEMRGQPGPGNELAQIPDADVTDIWAGIMKRLMAIPEYRAMFRAAYPGTPLREMTFAHASNAIAGFIVKDFHFGNTPWDRFLRGDDNALTEQQLEGAQTFLSIKCSICHNGAELSDDEFHNVALAQIGPGKGDGPSGRDDFGRMEVTGDAGDQYRFRTTPLRNAELTGPYGHDGSIVSLRDFIAHYSESDVKLEQYDPSQLIAALQGTVLDNKAAVIADRDPIIVGVVLPSDVVDRLMSYMSALTDPAARNLSRTVPVRVPSGLPVDQP